MNAPVMISEDDNMNRVAPKPQSVAIVVIATLGCVAVAFLLWGFVGLSAMSMHHAFGGQALPVLTAKLIQYRTLFWALPFLALLAGGVMIAMNKHSTPNLVLYVSTLVFLALVAIASTVVFMAIPWMPMTVRM